MKASKHYSGLLSTGLFLISFSLIIKQFLHLSDALNGILMGIGLSIELYAVFMLFKLKNKKAQ
ncbi:hypothetical protein I5M32_04325 [Pedobacter sp. SD-b]|uniref:Gliding motility protein GldL n=1 Tax=Pedobacter segetis TaxID=2793069 RepID=A0ABS1BH47_9SPHI|nr:hypothetical protein [Pedobacter segetis]MBK0382178.1 hypothetical protein [Pedobacter segetis]